MSTLRLLISDSYDPGLISRWKSASSARCPPPSASCFSGATLIRSLLAARKIRGKSVTPAVWKRTTSAARRSSGGGAVFHDLGNTCFTFMAGKPEYDKTISTSIVLNALNSLGVTAEASGRNDLVVKTPEGDRKVSGSAYRETMDRGFHHGTLLLNADLSRLANYLNPDKKKLRAKGITSVRGRVANLVDLLPGITHEQICDAIREAFFEHYGERVEAEVISLTKHRTCPTSRKPLRARAAGSGTSVRHRRFHTCWMSDLHGAALSCTLTWRRAILPARRSLRIVSILHRWRRWPHVYRAVCIGRICCSRSVMH